MLQANGGYVFLRRDRCHGWNAVSSSNSNMTTRISSAHKTKETASILQFGNMDRHVSFDRVEIIEQKTTPLSDRRDGGSSTNHRILRRFVNIDFYETCRDIKEIRTKLENRNTRFSHDGHAAQASKDKSRSGDGDDVEKAWGHPIRPQKKNNNMKTKGLRRKFLSPMRIHNTGLKRNQPVHSSLTLPVSEASRQAPYSLDATNHVPTQSRGGLRRHSTSSPVHAVSLCLDTTDNTPSCRRECK